MCGITAIASPDASDHERIREITDLLAHRGPDGVGCLTRDGVSLGHRRLSIIDLSERGAQPMANEDHSVFVVCNGEIYNYLDLRRELLSKGHVFRSDSDSEVLVHLYEEHGRDFLDRINGMFALALWDLRTQTLFAATDRLGKKPLYYCAKDDKLALASECKSLLPLPWVDRGIDPAAIDRYLSLRYVPAPLSMYKGVRKLEAASMLEFRAGRFSLRRYWSVPRQDVPPMSEATVDQALALISDAVAVRLHSDVPLGLYLSGGVDSSVLAAFMSRLAGHPLTAYTMDIDYEYNEVERSREIAELLGIHLHPVRVEPNDFDQLPGIMRYLDEPLGDLICIPSFLLAQEAKKALTVVLTGDGGDEIFCGYLHQKVCLLWNRLQPLLAISPLRRLVGMVVKHIPTALLNRLFDYPDHLNARERDKLIQVIHNSGDFGSFYEHFTSCFTATDKASLLLPEFAARIQGPSLETEYQTFIDHAGDFPFLSRLSLMDLKYWLPYSLVFRLDKLNMAHAVETRSPLLDYRVVEMALNVPPDAKMAGGENKILLRKIFSRLYPADFAQSKKQAFYIPVTERNKRRFNDWIVSMVNKESVAQRGLFSWSHVNGLLGQLSEGSMLVNRQLTALAMLELWFRVFEDEPNT